MSGYDAQRHFERARALHMAGNLPEAERHHRAVLAIDAGFVESLHALGMICLDTGRAAEAQDLLRAAASRQPGNPAIHNNLGVALAAAGRREEAAVAYRRALDLAPHAADPWRNLGRVLFDLDRPSEALPCLDAAARLAPGDAGVALLRGEALARLGRHEDAVAAFVAALRLRPDLAAAHGGKGLSLAALGRIDEARGALQAALARDPKATAYLFALADLGRVRDSDPLLARLEAASTDDLPADDRCRLHFAIAKAYDDLGRTDEAFDHFQAGNALAHAAVPYDETRTLAAMRALATRFTAERLTQDGGCDSARPIFVVGMPRSGTSLVEQVLASLPGAFGAGELPDFEQVMPPDDGTNPDWRAVGEAYVARLSALAPDATRVIDKMPLNFRLLGAIVLALPKARIVHVRRDPLDTCFSCYAKWFGRGMAFANDQGELGRFYRAYDALMAHWRGVLPPDAMLEVRYEALVERLEDESRRLAAFCGLDWDESCLAFHRTRRTVVTASLYQVRQPLYQSAVGRARPYSHRLGPLRAALEQP